jgi:hypothetical protein
MECYKLKWSDYKDEQLSIKVISHKLHQNIQITGQHVPTDHRSTHPSNEAPPQKSEYMYK